MYSYDSLYLEALGVQPMTFHHLEVLWKKVSENRYEDIVSFMEQLMGMNLPYDDIRILNKNTGRMIQLSRFNLGKVSFNEEPLIELQYREVGRKLGERFGLTKGGSVESYKDIVLAMVREATPSEETCRGFLHLLQEWYGYKTSEKMVIIEAFGASMPREKAPILVLGDVELHKNFQGNGIHSILIPEELIQSEKSLLYKACGEIGFILPDGFGSLEIKDKETLGRGLYEKCEKVLQNYVSLFEKREIARLDSKLKMFGGIHKVLAHVVLGTSAYREEKTSGMSYVVKLPYLDLSEKRIILQKTPNEYTIIRELLLMVEFAPKRNIDQDLHEIKKEVERIHLASQHSLREMEEREDTKVQEPELGAGEWVENVQEEEERKNPVKPHGREKSPKKEDISVIQKVGTLMSSMKEKLAGSGSALDEVSELTSWKLGPSPEEEEEIRGALVETMASSLAKGPEVYKRKLSTMRKKIKVYQGKELQEDEKLRDQDGIEPRAFLEAEYDCRCQVCENQIVFDSGKKWISVYHIQGKKDGAWFYDRPFNILGLCPNCYTMAKYSGHRDFSKILEEAQKVLEGETFAESVDGLSGDYYLIDVVLDNRKQQMKMSKVHMSYFAALVELDEAGEDRMESTI